MLLVAAVAVVAFHCERVFVFRCVVHVILCATRTVAETIFALGSGALAGGSGSGDRARSPPNVTDMIGSAGTSPRSGTSVSPRNRFSDTSERPRYAVTNKTSGRRLLRFLDLGPSLLSVVSNDGITEKHKYAYRELKIKLVDQVTVELDRGAAGIYRCSAHLPSVCLFVCH